MPSIFSPDFQEYIELFNKYDVEYMLVGGMAVNLYGYRRATGDMDLFVNPTLNNHIKIKKVHTEFGMFMGDMESPDDFINNRQFDVFTFGVSPVQIDIMTHCKGIEFETAYAQSRWVVTDGVKIRLIHGKDLLKAKEASNRKRDQADIEELKRINKDFDSSL